ncbi:zeta toxin family protein [Compostimonas suwonensis]|uniref:UDP-N-acetylglucosamine kinase n=1 Tax=Compostimonas suwonensis TaxID=1048394 RepID=A0A2M9C048_9MICO|nr:zeta toxin family protein [Compostimonas suwonensis]PJJ63692.1 zeta toxin [Compostimonas suwonensis]
MTEPEAASEARLRQVFDLAVRAAIFPPIPTGAPLLVLLGGQPAAGKTRAQAAIRAEHPELVSITGDDLRRYHPGYRSLVADDPLRMPAATAPTSAGLIRLALDHAIEHRYPVLLEGTFRDPAMVTGTATRFAEAGYRVEVVTVATPAPVSRLAAEQRFLAAKNPLSARWTPPEAHETALAGSPEVVAALEALPTIGRVRVYSRDRLLYDNDRTPDGTWRHEPAAAETLRAEQTRPLDAAEAVEWLARYLAAFDAARARPGYLGPATAPGYRRLQDDAARMIEVAADHPSADATALADEQRRRQVTLDTLAPPPRQGILRSLRDRATRIRPFRPASTDPPRHDPPALGR